jgi:hypothetical protein
MYRPSQQVGFEIPWWMNPFAPVQGAPAINKLWDQPAQPSPAPEPPASPTDQGQDQGQQHNPADPVWLTVGWMLVGAAVLGLGYYVYKITPSPALPR